MINNILDPTDLVNKIKTIDSIFDNNEEQDAHELLTALLHYIQDYINKIVESYPVIDNEFDLKYKEINGSKNNQANNSLINDISNCKKIIIKIPAKNETKINSYLKELLSIETLEMTRCSFCMTHFIRQEGYTVKSIEIIPNYSLKSLLRESIKPEILNGNYKYMCEKCNDKVEAKRYTIWYKLPQSFNIHLKRVEFTVAEMRFYKIKDHIETSDYIVLYDSNQNRYNYKLRSVLLHLGVDIDHGHYVTLVNKDDTWILINDEEVNELKYNDWNRMFTEIVGFNSYLLTYEMV